MTANSFFNWTMTICAALMVGSCTLKHIRQDLHDGETAHVLECPESRAPFHSADPDNPNMENAR